MKKVSIKEIARLANVSIGTVDRVLHNRGRVAKKTEQKIRRIISELKYKPNIFARNLKLDKTYHFGVLMPESHQDSHYWELPLEGIKRAAKELGPLKVRVHHYFFNRDKEESFFLQAQRALNDNLDGLIIAPILLEATQNFIKEIPKAMPYVFFDSHIPRAKPLTIVGQNCLQAGRLAAHLMNLLLPDGGDISITRSVPRDYHIDQRVEGFVSFMKGKKQFRLKVYDVMFHQSISGYSEITKKMLADAPKLKGMFVTTANTHPFAFTLASLTLPQRVAIIGFDLIEENVQLVNKGVIDFLISQKPEVQGYQSVYSLYRHLIIGEPVPAEILMPLTIITKENIDGSGLNNWI
jgi:LacI family transcriptional regulator